MTSATRISGGSHDATCNFEVHYKAGDTYHLSGQI